MSDKKKKIGIEQLRLGVCEHYLTLNSTSKPTCLSHPQRRYILSKASSFGYKVYSLQPQAPGNFRFLWENSNIEELEEWRETVFVAHQNNMDFVFGLQPPKTLEDFDVGKVAKHMTRFYNIMGKLPDGGVTSNFHISLSIDDDLGLLQNAFTMRYIRRVEELIISLVTKFRVKIYGYFPKDYRCEKRLYHLHPQHSNDPNTHTTPPASHPLSLDSPSSSLSSSSLSDSPSSDKIFKECEFNVTSEWRKREKYNMFRFIPGGVGLIYSSVDINVNKIQDPVTFSKFWSSSQIRRLSNIFNGRKLLCLDPYPCSTKKLKKYLKIKSFSISPKKKKKNVVVEEDEEDNKEEDDEEEYHLNFEDKDKDEDPTLDLKKFKRDIFQVFNQRKKEFRVLLKYCVDFDFWFSFESLEHSEVGVVLMMLKLIQEVIDFSKTGKKSLGGKLEVPKKYNDIDLIFEKGEKECQLYLEESKKFSINKNTSNE